MAIIHHLFLVIIFYGDQFKIEIPLHIVQLHGSLISVSGMSSNKISKTILTAQYEKNISYSILYNMYYYLLERIEFQKKRIDNINKAIIHILMV